MLRAEVSHYAFDRSQFDSLRKRVSSHELDPSHNRLATAPAPLRVEPRDLTNLHDSASGVRLRDEGLDALRRGKIAALVLNGGMATRFGGGAKGVVPVVEGLEKTSFLGVKLAEARQLGRELQASVPVVIMHSFATQQVSQTHLEQIDWSGLCAQDRYWFCQSIMPRVLPDGTALDDLPEAKDLDIATVYAAPGHGDTLGRLRASGTLAQLRARGVQHILVSNVDNLGASLDPVIIGAHLEAVAQGHQVSVEVVRRTSSDAGGCIAELPDGRHAIIEGFRLPEHVDMASYPHFNTNTLWLSAEHMDRDFELSWFSVRKKIPWPDGKEIEVVQFEQLIGQITELVPSAFLAVDRQARFWPIKTRDDLTNSRSRLEAFARNVGLVGP